MISYPAKKYPASKHAEAMRVRKLRTILADTLLLARGCIKVEHWKVGSYSDRQDLYVVRTNYDYGESYGEGYDVADALENAIEDCECYR